MNIPFSTRGAILARYALQALRARRVCVLASRASFTNGMAEAFITACKPLGIEVVHTLFYDADDPELSDKISGMFNEMTFDADGDVIFHAASASREAETVLRTLSQLLVHARLLGAGDYNDRDMLARFTDFPDTISFESDYAPDTSGARYLSFLSEFRKERQMASPKHALFGFDAAAMVLEALKGGSGGRERVMKTLQNPYIGLRSTIVFSSSCQNQALTVLRYHRGKLFRATLATE